MCGLKRESEGAAKPNTAPNRLNSTGKGLFGVVKSALPLQLFTDKMSTWPLISAQMRRLRRLCHSTLVKYKPGLGSCQPANTAQQTHNGRTRIVYGLLMFGTSAGFISFARRQ